MAYQVFARKYRPQNFHQIVGQDHVAETLKNSILTNRIGHAFLFTGPRGVGKTTTARILAKALQCKDGPVAEPCNTCDACREITSGNCLDVLEIDGASNRGIDEIRDLKEKIQYTPLRDRYKIYIIDEVHMLTKEAFNALLKTLEEPPNHAKFVFATTEIHKVPATIQSRCQRFDFKLLPVKAIADALQKICDGESIKITGSSLRIIARCAAGSLRDAQSLLEKVVSFSGENIDETTILPLLGLANPELLTTLIESVINKDPQGCFSSFDEIVASGADLLQFYAQIRDQFRVLLVMKSMKHPEAILDIPEEELAGWQSMIDSVTADELYAYLRILVEAEGDLRRSLNPRLMLEMIFLRMIRIERLQKISELVRQIEEMKTEFQSQADFHGDAPMPEIPMEKQQKSLFNNINHVNTGEPTVDDAKSPVEENTVAVDSPDTIGESVQESPASAPPDTPDTPGSRFVNEVSKKNLVLASYLEVGTFEGPDNGCVTVSYPETNRFAYEKILEKNNLKLLKKSCQKIFGTDVDFKVIIREVQDDQEPPELKKKDELKKKAKRNPLIKKTLEMFDGEITGVE